MNLNPKKQACFIAQFTHDDTNNFYQGVLCVPCGTINDQLKDPFVHLTEKEYLQFLQDILDGVSLNV